MTSASDIVETFRLEPHPEGGWYRQTWIADANGDERPAGTAIYYLLEAGQRSHWHRVDAVEIWHWYAGAPLLLQISDGERTERHTLDGKAPAAYPPQAIVPKDHWQSAEPLCTDLTPGWTLVGCTVSPAFRFEGFEMAPPGWEPGQG